MFGRNKRRQDNAMEGDDDHIRDAGHDSTSGRTLTNDKAYVGEPSKAQIKRATRTRLCWALLASFFLLITVVFVILVEVGSTSTSKIRTSIYFIKLDLANIIPVRVPNSQLVNSIAQTLGLHDFYTVGLWGYCQGNLGEGYTQCSNPKLLFWFNPVQILQEQLLAGATIALPTQINDVLNLIKTVSHWMFGLFLAGACLSFVMIFLQPIAIFSRWATLPIMIFTFLAALFTTVAAVIGTVMFIIMKKAVTSQEQLNIGANIGTEMFAFMWIAAGASILAWLIQLCLTCCCASRRDVKKGKKRGSKKAWRDSASPYEEKHEPKQKRGLFGRKK